MHRVSGQEIYAVVSYVLQFQFVQINNKYSFTALLQIQSSENSIVGHNYTMKCITYVPCDQQLSGLRWRNSTGHTLNTSTGGHVTALELHFQPLRVSDGGQYTCVAEYDGGGSRQMSEVVLVTGESS